MSATDHIKQYSAADIQRYLEGGMLPAEMHELEKAALEDPFLADAIEGMQQTLEQHDASLIQGHLQDIRQQVAERARKEDSTKAVAPVRAFRWWQVAAAAVVVLTGSIWALNYFNQSADKASENQLAIVTQETHKAPLPVTDSAAPIVADKALVIDANISEKLATDSDAVASYHATVSPNSTYKDQSNPASPLEQPLPAFKATRERAASEPVAVHDQLPASRQKTENTLTLADGKQVTLNASRADSLLKVTPGLVVQSDDANKRKAYLNSLDKTYDTKSTEYEQIVVAEKKRDTTAQYFFTKPQEVAMNRSRKELSAKQAKRNPDALLSGYISGRVTDQSNNPVSNALLRVEDNRVFYTDRQGQFKIPVKDTISVLNIAVASTGFYSQNVQLFNNSQGYNANYRNNISLNQLGVKAAKPQLNDNIRIRGVSTANQSDSTVSRNINYPEVMVQDAQPEEGWLEFQQYLEKNKQTPPGTPQLTGVVVVSFQLNKKGELSDFKIEQSLDKAYDDEALRLIKAGPAWKLNKGRKTKVTVLVRF